MKKEISNADTHKNTAHTVSGRSAASSDTLVWSMSISIISSENHLSRI